MRILRGMLALGLALCLGAPTVAAPASKPKARGTRAVKKHQHDHVLTGTVVSVHHGKEGHGTIKVKPAHQQHEKKKPSVTAKSAATKKQHHHHGEVTVHVDQHTKFVKATHQGGKSHHQPVTFAAVHKGEHVKIHLGRHHHAKVVEILGGQHQHQPAIAKNTTKPPTKTKPKKK